MTFLDTLKKNLTPELFAQVTDALGDDFDFDVVPRTRLNAVIRQRNELRTKLNGHIDNIPDGVVDPAPGDPNGGEDWKQKYLDLEQQQGNAQAQAIKDVTIRFSALNMLKEQAAIDPELILKANILDLSKVTVDDAGTVSGLDEVIKAVKEAKPHLFKEVTPPAPSTPPSGTGKLGGSPETPEVKTKEDFLKMSTEDQLKFKETNPDTFKSFLS